MSSPEPYRMGMWESFMYRCGYVRKDRHSTLDQPVGLCMSGAELEAALIQKACNKAAFDMAMKHFPAKFYTTWEHNLVGDVLLHFTDGTKAELTGIDAKTILTAGDA